VLKDQTLPHQWPLLPPPLPPAPPYQTRPLLPQRPKLTAVTLQQRTVNKEDGDRGRKLLGGFGHHQRLNLSQG